MRTATSILERGARRAARWSWRRSVAVIFVLSFASWIGLIALVRWVLS